METSKTISVVRSHFAGTVFAVCECGWKCHYWEDESDLEHTCKEDSE